MADPTEERDPLAPLSVVGANPPRVVYTGSQTAYRIQLFNRPEISNLLGENVLVAFYKCLRGLDRIAALEHLMRLNNIAADAPQTGPGAADEFGYSRNRTLLGFLLASTMHEMGEALQELCSAIGVFPDLRELATWTPLNQLRGEWHTAQPSSVIRNQLGAHLGHRATYVEGIRAMAADPVLLFEAAGPHEYDGWYPAPTDALLAACRIEDAMMEAFVARQYDAHRALPALMFAFLADVLDTRGIPVVDERTEEGDG
jgi:hypothetical protein